MNENNSNNNLENENEKNITTRTATEVTTYKKDKKKVKKDPNISIEYRKPSIFTSFLLMLIGAAIMAIVLLTLYLVKDNKDVEVYNELVIDTTTKEDKVENSIISYNVDGDLVVTLYDKLIVDSRRVPLGYGSKKADYSTIDDNEKLFYILESMKPKYTVIDSVRDKLHNRVPSEILYPAASEVKILDFNDVSKKYKRVFGVDKEVSKNDCGNHAGYVYEYNEEDKCFYGHTYPGGGSSGFNYSRKIIKCESNEDQTEIYIYDKFVCSNHVDSDKNGNLYSFYGTIDETDVIKERIREEQGLLYEGKTMDQMLSDLLDTDGREYKHTFKLDSAGNYYWYSSEKVN